MTCSSGRPVFCNCALIFSTLNLLATDVAALPSFTTTSSSILILSILIVGRSCLSLIGSGKAGSTDTGGNGTAWHAGAFVDVVASAWKVKMRRARQAGRGSFSLDDLYVLEGHGAHVPKGLLVVAPCLALPSPLPCVAMVIKRGIFVDDSSGTRCPSGIK